MNKYSHLLERLGMLESERIIYLTLLEHPYLMISDIAKHTRYHRPMVYRAIASLESDGYVEKSILEGKRYFYHITSPAKLRERLSRISEIADVLLPEMEAIHDHHHESPILSVKE
jgi:sugar-specific transcriptional regulator TrmB